MASTIKLETSDSPSCTLQNASRCDVPQLYPFVFEHFELDLPTEFVYNASVFFGLLNPSTWQSLSKSDKNRLKALLPECCDDDEKEKLAIDVLGGRVNFFFGNPLVQFYEKLKAGYFHRLLKPKLCSLMVHSHLRYEYWIRNHYSRLLRILLVRRRQLLKQTLEGSLLSTVRRHGRSVAMYENKRQLLRRRALTRARLMIMSCKAKVNETFSKAHDDISSMSTLGRLDSVDLDLYKPLGGNNMKRMLVEYRMLRKTHKDHPTLDFTDVTLENVIERSGLQQYFARMNERNQKAEDGDSSNQPNCIPTRDHV
uniref:ASX DEUBAD domain-containing protein n=1 Tax=Trichuris muris TaxID=70415 RepID=A0A5S6QGY8_TRIMR